MIKDLIAGGAQWLAKWHLWRAEWWGDVAEYFSTRFRWDAIRGRRADRNSIFADPDKARCRTHIQGVE